MTHHRGVIVLAVLMVAGSAVAYLTQLTTTPRIEAQQQALANRTLLDVLPAGRYDNQPLDHSLLAAPVTLAHSLLLDGHLAMLAGQPTAVLLRSQAQGYEGSIELLIAIDPQGRVMAVKTLRQSETPGLGGAIADWPNTWLQAFGGTSRQLPADKDWALKKNGGQFDQLTGATVTSRAVVQAVHDALRYFDEHKPGLTPGGRP